VIAGARRGTRAALAAGTWVRLVVVATALLPAAPACAQGTPPRFAVPPPSASPAPPQARPGAPSRAKTVARRPKRGSSGAPGAPAKGEGPAVTGVPGSVSVAPEKARIGDRIRLTATYGAPGAWTAAPGEDLKPGAKLGPFRILASDASAPGALTLELSPDDTGALAVPAFELVFRDAGGVSVTVAVPSARVTVASVIAEGDSTAISDLKPPAVVPIPWPWTTLAILAGAVLLAAAATWRLALYLKRARAPKPQPEIALPPGMTPEAWAREELAKILAAGLLEPGRHREAHIAIADLVRRYLELRFRVPAMERTTEEIADEMPRALIDATIHRLTIGALSRCDRVKFAKHIPPREEVDETVAQVREILDRGAPAAVPATPEEGPRAAAPPGAPPAAVDAAGTAA